MNKVTKIQTNPTASGMDMGPRFKVLEHFHGRCQELTSECCNIQERGFDNIRCARVGRVSRPLCVHDCKILELAHESSRMMIYEENFLGRSVDLCEDYPSLQAMGWGDTRLGSMHVTMFI